MILKKPGKIIAAILFAVAAVYALALVQLTSHASAAPPKRFEVTNCATNETNAFNPSGDCLTALPKVKAEPSQVTNGLKIVFGVAAGVALISLAIAAFNFATAATDAEKISRSKKAIVFSLIGLVIALSAEAIVLTVLGRL